MLLSIILLALSLAVDATVVAAACGATVIAVSVAQVALVAGLFGGFQAAMPLAGWWLGSALASTLGAWEKWVAFTLLAGVGGKMIHGAWRAGETHDVARNPFAVSNLLVLALATSIDAFAAGVTLPALGAPVGVTVAAIGITTALCSAAGLFAGRRLAGARARGLDAAAGVVLVALGVKALLG